MLPIGTRLRNCELVGVLGQGGFGITYRARDVVLGRDVAIKEYLPTALAVREGGTMVLPRSTDVADEFTWGRDRFLEEARTLAKFSQAPGIVQVYDFLEAHGTAYMVMALIEGETLHARLRRVGVLGAGAVEHILHRLLDGLERVHSAGFLHRDIKPANIILDASDAPHLIDFGASRAAMAGRSAALTAVFTPGFAAPEQFTSGKQGPWTDVYGLAATIHESITAQAPPSAFDRMVDDAYEPLAQRAPAGFAPSLLAAVDAGLVVRASDRPQSIASWRLLLNAEVASPQGTTVVMRKPLPSSVADPAPSAPVTHQRSRRGLAIGFAVIAALFIGLAAGGYFLLADKPAPQTAAVVVPQPNDTAAAETERLRAERDAAIAARQKVEDDAKALAEAQRAAEAEARAKADAEAKEKAAAEAKAKADNDAKAAAEALTRQTAEASEGALGLSTIDRQHVQVALSSLGFDTHGVDGVLGQRSRDMIAAWQKARNLTTTSFLNGLQFQSLAKEAAAAIAAFDQKRAEDEAKAKAAAAIPPAPTVTPPSAMHPPMPLEAKDAVLPKTAGGPRCGTTALYGIHIYPDKIDVHFRNGWVSYPTGPDGSFNGTAFVPESGNHFEVSGNVKSRTLSSTTASVPGGCTWSGKF